MSFTVTATQGGSKANGMEAALLVFTGQAGSPVGARAGGTSTTPNISITPNMTGSYVVGTLLGTGATPVADGVTFFESVSGGGAEIRVVLHREHDRRHAADCRRHRRDRHLHRRR